MSKKELEKKLDCLNEKLNDLINALNRANIISVFPISGIVPTSNFIEDNKILVNKINMLLEYFNLEINHIESQPAKNILIKKKK